MKGNAVISINAGVFSKVKGIAVTSDALFTDGLFSGIELEYLIIGADVTEIAADEMADSVIGTIYYRGAEGDIDIWDYEDGYCDIGEIVYDYDGPDKIIPQD